MSRAPVGRIATALLVLWAAFEIARSVNRLDGVIFTGYTQVGEVTLQGGDPYGLPINTWPPFFLFLASGLALLARISLPGALLLWQLGAVAAIWGACRLLARLAGEPPPPFTSAAVLVPVAMSARLLQEHLQHTQINLYLLLLVLAAFYCFRRRRDAVGGLALAAAASLRAVPIAFLPYLLYKRAWRAAAWTGGFLIVLNVALPLALLGPSRTGEAWRSWRAVAARETADPVPHYPNQSLLAALKRLLTAEGGARDPVQYAVASWPTEGAVRVFYGVAALGALGLAWAFRRHPPGLADPVVAGEVAVGLAALTLVSPLAWKAHFVTLLAAYWVVWRGMRDAGDGRRDAGWGMRVAWWASFACLTLSAPALVGERVNNALESLNVITVGALLVVGLALSVLRRRASELAARHASGS
ncbi:MAG: glycosyltransferase family 87 protein [Gemmatimonadales bacterium]